MNNNASKIRFGIIGTNFISDWVMAGAKQDARFEAAAVCSRNQDTADAFASRHGIAHTFTSLEAMAQSHLIDAVYIASPNHLHAEQSLLCMSHGKHVLCEKPLAANAAQARRMIALARSKRLALMEAMKPVLTPNFRAVIDNLHRIGTVRRYFSSYCQYSSRYDKLKAGELPNAFRADYANGALVDIGIYTIYPMLTLFGKPLQIQANGLLLPTGVDGQGAVNFRYPEMNATVLYSKIADSALPTEIQGESGTITLDRINIIGKVSFSQRRQAASGKNLPTTSEDLSAVTDKDEYYYEVAEFIDIILSARYESAINSHANSLATLDVMDEIRRQLGVVYPADGLDAEE
ncbi:MAG: Gfo/Idh/MocA family oxidoreductase [Tannerellaceae bacterium]|jgi:predicted dehydrogenase|nr:Gfo/Idh/MocA family oxidoreductase [Tannerellaceae bacterium]